jgi:ABC-type transport system involved in multi-copper enzyme maturation permease subunit
VIWLTWRQFRLQAIVTAGALLALAILLVYLGHSIRSAYTNDIVGCTPATCDVAVRHFINTYEAPVGIAGMLLLGIPGIIGVFWGAPLVTRELEERTDKLVWNQSVTRTRWLAVKLGLIALFTAVVAGLFSLLLTWSASRFDLVQGNRFAATNFAARNVVPVGYALFALALGTVIGLMLRRTLPAMALTLAVFAVIQIVVPNGIRQHLMTPVTTTVTLGAAEVQRINGLGVGDGGGFVDGYSIPGSWSLSGRSKLYKPDGTPFVAGDARHCMTGDFKTDQACLASLNMHFENTYQPGNRYWPFQWIELSGFLVLTLLLTGLGFWWIRRRLN